VTRRWGGGSHVKQKKKVGGVDYKTRNLVGEGQVERKNWKRGGERNVEKRDSGRENDTQRGVRKN